MCKNGIKLQMYSFDFSKSLFLQPKLKFYTSFIRRGGYVNIPHEFRSYNLGNSGQLFLHLLSLYCRLADSNNNNILDVVHPNHKFNYFSCFYGDESVIEQNIVRNFLIDCANDYTQNAMLSLGGNNNTVIVSFNTFKH